MYAFVALLILLNSVRLKGAYLDNRANIFLPFASECMCSTGVDPVKAYGYIYDLKYPEDPCLKCFVGCMLTKVGFFTSDGEPVYIQELDPTHQITQNAQDISFEMHRKFFFHKSDFYSLSTNYDLGKTTVA
ncbi:hypothetical protein FQR65_LT14700 [Abscondita terminalis]|nr:hypothetical protein FQR65_LT14700 [Abscondita terminalis]